MNLEGTVGVAGRQHSGDEADGVEEGRPRHIVLLTVKVRCQVESQLVTQLVRSVHVPRRKPANAPSSSNGAVSRATVACNYCMRHGR